MINTYNQNKNIMASPRDNVLVQGHTKCIYSTLHCTTAVDTQMKYCSCQDMRCLSMAEALLTVIASNYI